MAKYINGMISGKVGDLVFSSKNGVNYVKRLSRKSVKGPSPMQVIQRTKFAIVMHFLSPLRSILNESYRKINPKLSGLNIVVKQILTEAITGEFPDLQIDFSKVCLIRGSLSRPCVEMAYVEKLNELHLSWQNIGTLNSYLNDELLALIYCPALTETWQEIQTGIMRFEQGGVIKLPVQFLGHDIHVWLAYRSSMMDSFSHSVYMGQVFTQKTDRHENA